MTNSTTHYVPLSRPEAFMAIAALFSARSKDPVTQVGAVIVDKNEYVAGSGFNGFATGLSDDDFPWHKTGEKYDEKKYPYIDHAETNAFDFATRPFDGGTLYVTVKPCHKCAKIIVQQTEQGRIKCVRYLTIYKNGIESNAIADDIFEKAKIPVSRLERDVQNVTVDFDTFKHTARSIDQRVSLTGKRLEYLPWEETFMGAASIMAQCSKNPNYQQGAVLVDPEHKTLGFGFNGIPKAHNSGEFDWSNPALVEQYEISASLNCMINSKIVPYATLYTTHYPDEQATHKILKAKVEKIIYGHTPDWNSPAVRAVKRMLTYAHITDEKFVAATDSIRINLENGEVKYNDLRVKRE